MTITFLHVTTIPMTLEFLLRGPMVCMKIKCLDDPGLRVAHGRVQRQRVLTEFRQEPHWGSLFQEYKNLLVKKGLPVPFFEPTAAQE